MNRSDRRAAKRDIRKAAETINKLSPNQVKLIDQVSTEKAQRQAEAILISYQRVVYASLAEHGFNNKQIEDIFNVANELMDEESIKSIKLNDELKRSGNIEMAKKKIEDGVIKEINTLMDAGMNRKEVIEAVLFKFPNMSKAMIINAYQEVKESRKQEDPEVNKAAEQILEIIEGEDTVKKIDVNEDKVIDELANAIKEAGWTEIVGNKEIAVEKEIKEKAPFVEKVNEPSKLKVLTMTLKGENGTYRACENGVELTDLGSIVLFENVEQVDEFANEIKQVFAMIKA